MRERQLAHPGLLQALASAGHGAQILIADGHYPVSTATHPSAPRIYLNLRPGLVDAASVLQCLTAITPIESATVMAAAGLDDEPPIWATYRALLRSGDGPDPVLDELERADFYERARDRDLAVAIATGELAIYANLLLTIGVRSDLDTRSPRPSGSRGPASVSSASQDWP